jgi:hypothetical protein
MLANGTAGQILQANGTTVAPSWVAASSITAGNASTLLTATWASPAAIGSGTPAAGTFTTLTSTGNVLIGDAEATDTHAIKGATALLANSASAGLTVTQTGAGNAFVVEDSATPDSTPFAISATGNVGIGGAPVAAYRLLNYGPVTGATTMYGTSTQGDIQSDVTAAYYGYRSTPSTQATAFTLTNMLHYVVEQGTIGAGSSVTNQYGFYSGTGAIGATNNFAFAATNTAAVTAGKTAYGFYCTMNIATGGGTTWAMYLAGTAYSYIGGNLGVGTTPTSTSRLTTAASTTAISSLNIPHGAAPTSPVNGDIWTTTAGLFVRINGVTVGPLS